MQDIYIHGGAMTPFGRHPGVLAPELAQRAILKALADADVPASRIQAVYCANVLGGMILGQLIVRDLGLKGIPVYNVENACASGATGVHLARHALLAGQYDTVLVFGIEQLTALGGGTIPLQRNDHKTELYARSGMVLPAVYAMRGTRFLYERDARPADLAEVAVKNRHHGSLNPYAQQRNTTTVEEVLASRMIADPLTLLQCCPSQVDGAAALVLGTQRPAQARPVKVLSSVVVSGMREAADDDMLDAEITARAARQAYVQAGLGPQDVDVVELHDAFTIAELLYYEALGLAPRGDAVALLKSGATRLGGRVPVNPSGGLLAKGHPLGATGVAQMVEILWQLQGRAGARQVAHARIGLTQCTGGGIAGVDHAASSVHLLGV
ncbi:thiolase family protein [Cupriavidus neocaledonicus]|uniref:propanoyl-CoA C-acyltransferase n=1 Tax=Cupriavidus neocaledonicus TaxID=1040979 RepID=A0A375HMQ3_9BURK|nr:thiolase family protein [Cupriavidus neocaledonicus]SOZ38869.1 Lipid-transfer protein [Cupriavidus neocaledonicus]SPD59488.1 Propanoyl-CoA acyltransferase [Cupriavidus neocaledonicus]